MVRELEDKDNARHKELEKARTDKTDALTEQRDKHEVAVLSVRLHACTPDAPWTLAVGTLSQVTSLTSSALRSRERRFESYWGALY
jgi:hypothetical protein